MTEPAEKEKRLLGTPEWRSMDFEVRSEGNSFTVRGYASLFDSEYPVGGGPAGGGWFESVDRSAFDKTLQSNPDVHFLINHEGRSLARTKSGTLRLSTDPIGLHVEASIDRRDDLGRSLEISMERGDLDEMSFAFRTVRNEWTDDYTRRRLLEVNIDKGDVSVVNNGANDQTRIRLANTREALELLSHAELVEVRHLDNPLASLIEARSHLDRLIREVAPKNVPQRMAVADAIRVIEGL